MRRDIVAGDGWLLAFGAFVAGIFIVASVNSVGVGVGNTFDRVETAL